MGRVCSGMRLVGARAFIDGGLLSIESSCLCNESNQGLEWFWFCKQPVYIDVSASSVVS